MEIKLATQSHIPEIVKLWQEFMVHHEDIDPRFPMRKDAPSNFEKYLRELMQSEENLVLVALDNDRVIGFATCCISEYTPIWELERYGSIDSIAIQSSYRRRGIGEQMLAKIYEWFKLQDVDRIELSVAARNQTGYSFWIKHGFRDFSHRLYVDIK